MGRTVCGLGALSWVLCSGVALADSAAAEVLYQQGKQLGADGDWKAACPKFAGSYKLDKQLGTLLNLANCREQEGRVASAWARYNEALEWAQSKGDDRLKWIVEQRDRLVARLPRLTVVVTRPAPGLSVWRGEERVIAETYGVALPLDPGEHILAVKRGPQLLGEQKVTVGEGQQRRVELDLAAVAAAHPAPIVAPRPPSRPPTIPRPPYDPTQRNLGFIVGGVGATAVLIAAGLGAAALVKKGEADEADACVNKLCAPEGLQAAKDGATFADVSQWVGIGGLAALAIGATVLLTAPSEQEQALGGRAWLSPWVSPDSAGVGVMATF